MLLNVIVGCRFYSLGQGVIRVNVDFEGEILSCLNEATVPVR